MRHREWSVEESADFEVDFVPLTFARGIVSDDVVVPLVSGLFEADALGLRAMAHSESCESY
jgi:hypothetical protein